MSRSPTTPGLRGQGSARAAEARGRQGPLRACPHATGVSPRSAGGAGSPPSPGCQREQPQGPAEGVATRVPWGVAGSLLCPSASSRKAKAPPQGRGSVRGSPGARAGQPRCAKGR